MMDGKSKPTSAWSPLRLPIFRTLWIATIFSNIGTWVHDVGAGWLMTSLSPSPLMVSLVQTAGTLPMFILALPAGALSDIVDRRKILITAQYWMLGVAIGLGVLTYTNMTEAWSLLIMTFCLSLGAAFSLPAWSAVTPELVPREELPPALALNSMGINISRAIGPAIGGYLISTFGTHWAFFFNAISFLTVLIILYRWDRPPKERTLPAERFFSAMRLGIRFTQNSPELKAVVYRTVAFIIPASALWSLLPLVAKDLLQGSSSDYGILLTFIGIGAVFGATLLPRLKKEISIDSLVAGGIVLLAGVISSIAAIHNFQFVCIAMFLGGMAWLTLLSNLNVAAQTSVPSWVRARAMAIYFMLFFFGGMAAGSFMWGVVANQIGIPFALYISAASLVLGLLLTQSYRLDGREGLNLVPSMHWPAPEVSIDMDQEKGPVLVTIDYEIDVKHSKAFKDAMEGIRLARLRDGALHWGLFNDTENSGRFVENFIVESWEEHLRQHDRVTQADKAIQENAWSFHIGESKPKVSHFINVV
jgi:MFS family permease